MMINDEKNVNINKYANNANNNSFSLNDEEILLIVSELINIENSYQFPVDIEFGIENNILYIFQARPITTYNKLPYELMTLPNEQRILYFDETLGMQGLEQSLSILGSELYFFRMRYIIISRDYYPNPKEVSFFSYYGRHYQNISELLYTISAKNLVEKLGMVNSFIKDIVLKYADQYQYKRINIFQRMYLSAKTFVCLYWWGNLKFLANPYKYSNQILENYKNDFQKLLARVKLLCDDALNEKYTFKDLTETIFYDYGSFFTYAELNLVYSIGKGFQTIIDLFSPYFDLNPDMKIKVFGISKCYVNSTNIIGIELFKLSNFFNSEIYKKKSFEEFLLEYKEKKFPEKFYTDFQEFIDKYGCRCEGEIDIKNLRYFEEPEKVVKLIYDLIINFDKSVKTPMEIFEEAEKNRPKLYEELLNFSKEKNFDKEFDEAFHYLNLFYKEKETGKYYYCQILEDIKIYLNEIYQKKLEKSGLFANKNEIYDLTVYQLSDIIEKPDNFDREEILNLIKENLDKRNIMGNWKNRPMIFDSRGRMFYPERNVNLSENEIKGESVSSGIIKGSYRSCLKNI